MPTGTEMSSKIDKSPVWLYITVTILLIPVVVALVHSLSERTIKYTALLDPTCDLHLGPCQSSLSNGGKVSLSIEPRPIKGLEPLQLIVRTDGIEAQSVKVDFRGVDMNMGFNRPQLKMVADGQYTGTWVLASCGLERMVWEATVLIETGGVKLAAPFRLEVAYK